MQSVSLTSSHKVLTPRPVKRGALIGVVSPSGPVDSEYLEAGLSFFKDRGFQVTTGRHVKDRTGYLAGGDNNRIEDLNAMISDPEVSAVVFARGGYGVMRILDRVVTERLSDDPIPLVGMSDLTALQFSLYKRLGLITFSGPMPAAQTARGLDEPTERSLLRSLTEPLQDRALLDVTHQSIKVLRDGRADGVLLGGCLSMISALIGTSHFPDLSGTILFLEDVNEPPYRVDRMLTQLKLAGALENLSGVVLGHFIGPGGKDLKKEAEDILFDVVGDSDMPMISGFPHGHALPNITLPHGATVSLSTEPLSLKVAFHDSSL